MGLNTSRHFLSPQHIQRFRKRFPGPPPLPQRNNSTLSPTTMTSEGQDEAVEAQVVYLAEEAADVAFHEETTANVADAPAGDTTHGLKLLVTAAGEIKDKGDRDASLLAALRSCRTELEEAKRESDAAARRFDEIKHVYDLATRVLAGYTPLEERIAMKQKSRRESENGASKRARVKRESSAGVDGDVVMTDEAKEPPVEVPEPTNPITMPTIHTTAFNMPAELVDQHKEAFYQRLLNCSVADLETYTPSANSANLKSKAQLAEWIYIAQNWNTGADGLDAGAFRAKYKTWYSRMKPVTVNLGRRTGIHLRHIPDETGENALTVLCRHSKDGSKSLPYLPIDSLFDALFEIHAVELSHRGRDATKTVADDRYANIPDAQVRHFIETCPVCLTRKSGRELNV